MKITFLTPHQRSTSGGVYAIHQCAKLLATRHEVTLAVAKGEVRPVCGCAVVPFSEAPATDIVIYSADSRSVELPRGLPVCYIQGFGAPGNPDVLRNLGRRHHVIASARWLVREAAQHGCTADYVPYGIDRGIFRRGTLICREPSVLMMTHRVDWKGTQDGLEALRAVRRALPNVRIRLFGTQEVQFEAEFIAAPSRRAVADLMRKSTVFVCSSWEEGFGMPGLEAMACGAAVATTDTKGSRDYAVHGETALVVPTRQPAELAEAIRCLLEQPKLRRHLVAGGLRMADSFPDWPDSAEMFERVLVRALYEGGVAGG